MISNLLYTSLRALVGVLQMSPLIDQLLANNTEVKARLHDVETYLKMAGGIMSTISGMQAITLIKCLRLTAIRCSD